MISIFGGGWKSSQATSDLSDYAKRSYVDARALNAPDLSIYIKKTGDGDLDMDGNRIMNVGKPIARTDAVSVKDVQDGLGIMKANVVTLDGQNAMKAHLDLNSHRIENVGTPHRSEDAANRYYVDTRLAQIKPIITIWAEERGPLVSGEFEWSFGSGSDGSDHGKVGYVMMVAGRILRMSISSATRNSLADEIVNVAVTVNGEHIKGYEISKPSGRYSSNIVFQHPLDLALGDIVNFQTLDTARISSAGIVALLIELNV